MNLQEILNKYNETSNNQYTIDRISKFDAEAQIYINGFNDIEDIKNLNSVSPVYIIGGYAYWFLSGGFVHIYKGRNGFEFNNASKFLFNSVDFFNSDVKKNNWFKFNSNKFEALVTEFHFKYTELNKLNEEAKNLLNASHNELKDNKYLFDGANNRFIYFGAYAKKYCTPYIELHKNTDGQYYVIVEKTESFKTTDVFDCIHMIDNAEQGKIFTLNDYINLCGIGGTSYGFKFDIYLEIVYLYFYQNPTKNKFIIDGIEIEILGKSFNVGGKEVHNSSLHQHLTADQLLELRNYLIDNFYQ